MGWSESHVPVCLTRMRDPLGSVQRRSVLGTGGCDGLSDRCYSRRVPGNKTQPQTLQLVQRAAGVLQETLQTLPEREMWDVSDAGCDVRGIEGEPATPHHNARFKIIAA